MNLKTTLSLLLAAEHAEPEVGHTAELADSGPAATLGLLAL